MVGDALTNDEYPRIVNEKHFDRLLGLMQDVTTYSGGHSDRNKLQIEPTVLVDVTENSPVMCEEIFGPLLPVIPYNSLDEAEEFVLRHKKPLALYLFTTNKETEKRIFRKLSFGGGCVNDTIMHLMTNGLGFGGVGHSGMHSFETFSHTKGIYKKSLLFPYKEFHLKAAHMFMK